MAIFFYHSQKRQQRTELIEMINFLKRAMCRKWRVQILQITKKRMMGFSGSLYESWGKASGSVEITGQLWTPTTVRSNNITDISAHVTDAPLSSTPPSLWRHPKFQPKERWECEHDCMQRDLRLLQMNARINFNLPVMIPSYFPSEWRFICLDLSKRGVWEGADKLKSHPSASSCTLSGRKMQKQYSPQHSLIQLSFISAALD